eukprot:3323621-Prymnesium_polylepis.1
MAPLRVVAPPGADAPQPAPALDDRAGDGAAAPRAAPAPAAGPLVVYQSPWELVAPYLGETAKPPSVTPVMICSAISSDVVISFNACQ